MIEIPPALSREWANEEEWLADLPRLVTACAEQWSLRLETPVDTPHSLVVPAGETVLKLNAPSHAEAEHEADALEVWAGRGAVLLLARDDERRALLLERCRPGTQLGSADPASVDLVLELVECLPDSASIAIGSAAGASHMPLPGVRSMPHARSRRRRGRAESRVYGRKTRPRTSFAT